jgi:hypothetical protein
MFWWLSDLRWGRCQKLISEVQGLNKAVMEPIDGEKKRRMAECKEVGRLCELLDQLLASQRYSYGCRPPLAFGR